MTTQSEPKSKSSEKNSATSKSESELRLLLQKRHEPDSIERVGFVARDGSIIEVVNISPDPYKSFIVRGEDIMKYAFDENIIATWHTHPQKDANLTVQDNEMFLNHPQLRHYIIGTDGVRCYRAKNRMVVHA